MATQEISFTISKGDRALIDTIAKRACELEAALGGRKSALMDWVMDFTATHANGNPLRLSDLLAADNPNFLHDAFGIAKHLDRTTGKLTDHFSPRYSARQATGA